MSNIVEKELEFLFPESTFELGGQEFSIKPFSFVETQIVALKLKDVLHLFAGEITPMVLAEVYSTAFEGVRDIIAMSLSLKPKTVEQFDQASALIAITQIVRVNKDFFVERVEATMTELTEMVMPSDANSPLEK